MKKAKPTYATWQNILYVIKGAATYDKMIFLYFGFFTLVSAVSPFIGIFFPKWILQELIGLKRPETLIMLLLAFFACASAFGFLTAWLKNAYYPHMIKIRFSYIRQHQDKCMTTDFQNTENPQFLNDMETGFRCLQSNDIGIEGLLHKLFAFAGNLLALAGYAAIIMNLNIFILLYLAANVLISYYATFATKKYEHDMKDEISDNDRRVRYLYNVMYDFSYGKELRLFGIRDWIASRFQLYKKKRLNTDKNIQRKLFHASLIDVLLLLIREGIVYAYLIYLVVGGKMTIPDFTMYFASVAAFAAWLNTMLTDIAHMRAQNLDICDFRSFIERKDEMDAGETIPIPEGPYAFEFKNVSFKYPNSDQFIYKGLNLIIPAGQKLAIVGHNGAGKTTFVKLLCRLYDVSDGEILLNGINIKRLDKREYYKKFSAVFQEVKALAFSVAENISLTDKPDRNKLNCALAQAGMQDKINSLKNGTDTSMLKILDDEGVEFSGGENQKVMIARALYKDGEVMVLDEPTAALDALAEYNIYMQFNRMVENKTAVYVSHRLASTHFCDRIAMFENGKVIEYGTHEELMAKGGAYADMFAVQAKYYREEEAV